MQTTHTTEDKVNAAPGQRWHGTKFLCARSAETETEDTPPCPLPDSSREAELKHTQTNQEQKTKLTNNHVRRSTPLLLRGSTTVPHSETRAHTHTHTFLVSHSDAHKTKSLPARNATKHTTRKISYSLKTNRVLSYCCNVFRASLTGRQQLPLVAVVEACPCPCPCPWPCPFLFLFLSSSPPPPFLSSGAAWP